MFIKELQLINFRGFKALTVSFSSHFSLIVGNNGSGKSSILEGLTVAAGSFLLGIRDADSRHIRPYEVHIMKTENGEEEQFPVIIKAKGAIEQRELTWIRELNSSESDNPNRTTYKKALSIKKVGEKLDLAVREGQNTNLPIIVYYSTGRLWKEYQEKSKDEPQNGKREVASRFRGYRNCLQATSTFSLFMKWYRGKELARIQKGEASDQLIVVKQAIISSLPDFTNIYYEFDPDKEQTLMVEFKDGRVLPFSYLSDGTRNILALIGDIAHRCVLLNPHFKTQAAQNTEGVVLIDELDLHLHPDWQKKLIKALRTNFPKIQFIASSHSPFLIQEMSEGELIRLDNQEITVGSGAEMSIEDIAEQFQHMENPQWSDKRNALFENASAYFKLLKNNGKVDENERQIKEKAMLENMKYFSSNPAYDAFIEQFNILNGHE